MAPENLMWRWVAMISIAVVAPWSGAACGPRDSVRSGEPRWEDRKFEQQGKTCRRGGGQWHANLRSCVCPEGTLFSVRSGCNEPSWTDDGVGDMDLIGPVAELTASRRGRRALVRALAGLTVEGRM